MNVFLGIEQEMEDRRRLLQRAGVALAVHLASYLVSHLNFPTTVAEDETGTDHKSSIAAPVGFGRGLNDGLLVLLQNEEALANVIHGTSTTPATVANTATTAVLTTDDDTEQSPKNSRDEEELLLQEAEGEPEHASPVKPVNIKSENKEAEKDVEILYLSNLVQSLWHRKRSLEIEMLEYYGLKEQEAAVRELESRLKLTSVEAKCLSLQMESLKDENQRLKLQASEYSRTKRELESARAKVKHLKRRMRYVHMQASEKIASLEKRISVLHDVKQKDSEDEANLQNKLKRLKELEDEADELRKENSMLAQENLDLSHRLESADTSVFFTLEGPQAEVLEEVNRLREANEELEKKMELLQTDRCRDVEELVYLRWLNACLRYEQRDHQPSPGKTIAKDLSKSLSPRSGEKVKQLILDHAYAGFDDAEYSSQESNGECDDEDDPPLDDSFMTKDIGSRKSKFLGKLKKLVLRKGSKNNKVASVDRTPGTSPSRCASPKRRTPVSTCSSITSGFTEEHSLTGHLTKVDDKKRNKSAWYQAAFRSPFNVAGEKRLSLQEDGKIALRKSDSFNCRRRVDGDDNDIIGQDDPFHQEEAENVQINKYAVALLSSRASPDLKR